jgi:hypothetical protein
MIKKYFPNADLKYHQLTLNYPYFQKKTIRIKFRFFLFEPQFMRGTPLRGCHKSCRLVHFFRAINERKKMWKFIFLFFIFNKSVHSCKRLYFYFLNITNYLGKYKKALFMGHPFPTKLDYRFFFKDDINKLQTLSGVVR